MNSYLLQWSKIKQDNLHMFNNASKIEPHISILGAIKIELFVVFDVFGRLERTYPLPLCFMWSWVMINTSSLYLFLFLLFNEGVVYVSAPLEPSTILGDEK